MKNRVAIVGLSFRLPGTTREQFWPDLLASKDLVTEVDRSRWSQEAYFNPRKSEPGCSYTFSAGSLGDVSGFDAGFFGISPREAAQMDPQQRLLLELTWESLENAGIKPSEIRGSRCGVYIGIASADYSYRLADDLAAINSSVATGNTASIAANRISYVFDLHGPSMALDTACSSSLVAFHQACQSIVSGECTQAITGGVSLHLHPYGFLIFSKATMLSQRGICNVFDAAGDGYVRSEGGGIFFLKNYEQALADGDQILAVVAASAVNTDGKKSGLTVPSSQAQSDLLRQAYEKAGIDASSIDYIEAHGTGTAVGDPIETRALGEALGQQRSADKPLLIGSVKSNLGHLEAASGVAGMVKALHCIMHRTVPATIHLHTPNPNIDFDGLNIKVVTESTPLRESGKLVIGVNSFGFGGANAHVIIESPEEQYEWAGNSNLASGVLPLMLSGKSQSALKAAARQYSDFLGAQPASALYNIAYGAAFHRELHDENRALVFGSDPQALAQALDAFANNAATSLPLESGAALPAPSLPVFVYSGNGSQWEGMGKRLLAEEPAFKRAVQEVDQWFKQLADFSIEDELAGKNGAGRYELTEIAQPALFALQVGVTEILRQRGIVPAAVIGHSVGEVAAAWACGALTLEQAVRVIYHRSKWQGSTKGQGQMTAVAMGEGAIRPLLDGLGLALTLAGVNSSRGVTIAGDPAQLALLEAVLAERKVFHKRLSLDYAFHSPVMDSIEAGVKESLAGLLPGATDIPFYSTVTGGLLVGTELGAAYWWHNIRQPVVFEQAVKAMQSDAFTVFVELGPHAVLRGYIKDCLKDEHIEGRVIPTLARDDDAPQRLWEACAQVMVSGAQVDWAMHFPQRGKRVELPAYPWQRERHWHTASAESYQLLQRNKAHPYLGYRLHEDEWAWENQIDVQLYPTLADHVVGDAIVFPGTAYAEMALAAAQLWQPAPWLEIEELEIRSPLLLGDGHSKTVRFHLEPGDGSFTISSRDRLSSEPWTQNAVGRIVREAQNVLLEQHCPELPERPADFDTASHHALTTAVGLTYGPAFQAIEKGWVDGQAALATFVIPESIGSEMERMLLHPALLDCAFQLLIDVLHDDHALQDGTVFVPTRMGRLIFSASKSRPQTAQATLVRRGPHSLVADFTLFDAEGIPVAWVKQARFRGVRLQKATTHNIRYLGEHCIPKPHPRTPDTGTPLPLELLKEGLRSALHTVKVQKSLRKYAEEIEPLLDALCSGFAAQALKALAGGEELTQESVRAHMEKLPGIAPFLMRLLGMLEEDGAVSATGSGWRFVADSDAPSAQDIWNSLVADYPDHFPIFHAVGRVGLHLEDILSGRLTAAEVLPRECGLGTLSHQTMGVANIQSVGSSIRSIVPHLLKQLPVARRFRIVELSEGPSSYAAQILPSIDFDRCDYVLATPSATTIEEYRPLQERFPGVETRLVDFAADLANEFVVPGERAQLVILTSDFLSEDAVLKALLYARQHLGAGGTLIFGEQNPSRWMGFVFGGQRSWWSETLHGGAWASRHRHAARWQPQLAELGFQAVTQLELLAESVSGPYMLLAQVAGTGSEEAPAEPAGKRAWIMLADEDGYSAELVDHLGMLLEADGHSVIRVSPGAGFTALNAQRYRLDAQSPEQIETLLAATSEAFGRIDGVLHLQGLGRCDPDSVLEHPLGRCASAAAIVQACEAASVSTTCWLVTARALKSMLPGHSDAPRAFRPEDSLDAPLLGFARSLMNEASNFAVRLIDIAEPENATGVEPIAVAMARELLQPDAEQEITLTATGKRFASRLRLEPGTTAPPAPDAHAESDLVRLGFQFPGQLRNLRWESHPAASPGDREVEIEVRATGLNFRDVMYALGLLSDEAVENGFAGASLGLELSGVVLRVGSKVEDLAVGDKVVAFGPSCFSNRVITKASATAVMPPGVTYEAASTIPSTFFTAYYALHHLARLQSGEKVLIHGAAGGVGIAAIQVAKWCGAEIFATAGSEEKRDFLDLLGVDHILDSRSLAFADEILHITEGLGIDVVLNSLAGEAINRNFSVLKPFGRFIELGKRDFYENTKIGLRPFRNNISYFGVDADQLMRDRPDLTKKLFQEVMALFRDGVLHPLPYHVFDAAEIVDAFRYMQQSRQIGKIVVTYRNGIVAHKEAIPAQHPLSLSAESSYLVTGGLSGFGLTTAEWLADKGAHHLVLVSRSGPVSAEAVAAIAGLEARGVKVHAVACDVSDEPQLAALMAEISGSMPPLRGLVHAAMVIDDGLIRNMNPEQMRRVFAPKILGAHYLHQLTSKLELDFFVLFSSATTLFGNPGQGNYVAANAYLEALADARRAAGLPATCVRWGALDDVGFLARNEQIKAALQSRMGGAALHSSVALNALESMLVENRSGLGVLELDWKALSRFLPAARAPRFSGLSQGGGDIDSAAEDAEDIQRLLAELSRDELVVAFSGMLKEEVGEILRIAPDKIDENQSMFNMGLDSLMGVELALAVEGRFGVKLPVMALKESPTIAKLAEKLCAQLSGGDAADEPAPGADTLSQVEQAAAQHGIEETPGLLGQIAQAIHSGEDASNNKMIH